MTSPGNLSSSFKKEVSVHFSYKKRTGKYHCNLLINQKELKNITRLRVNKPNTCLVSLSHDQDGEDTVWDW